MSWRRADKAKETFQAAFKEYQTCVLLAQNDPKTNNNFKRTRLAAVASVVDGMMSVIQRLTQNQTSALGVEEEAGQKGCQCVTRTEQVGGGDPAAQRVYGRDDGRGTGNPHAR